MDNIDNSFNRFWYIRIIIAIIVLTLTVKFALSSPAHLSESDSELIIKNAAFEVSEIITDAVTEEIPSTTEKTTEEKTTEKILTVTSSEKYETPEDIIKTEQEYISTYSGAAEGGSVEEVFFRTSGATDTISGIAIKNSTATKKPDFSALINEGPELSISDKSEPVVLIFHTHTTESYLMTDNGIFYTDYKTRSEDSSKNMVRVGDAICSVLEKNGIGYIHDTDIYDKNYDGAYSRSRISVERYLEEYPSIQIVIDVHRDAIYYSDTSRCKPTAEIDGKKAAQLMIISGAEEGYITDFPYWEDNLRFSLCFQKTAEEMYPGLMKPLYFCQRKYNMDVTKCSFLLEVGTDANTLEEAVYSGYLTGNVLSEIIKGVTE